MALEGRHRMCVILRALLPLKYTIIKFDDIGDKSVKNARSETSQEQGKGGRILC